MFPYDPDTPEGAGGDGAAAYPYVSLFGGDGAEGYPRVSLLGGDGALGARTLLRDLDRSRVADLDLEREDLSSGLRDIVAEIVTSRIQEACDNETMEERRQRNTGEASKHTPLCATVLTDRSGNLLLASCRLWEKAFGEVASE